ncbi:MAG: flavin reductase family protein [Eggerthellaceae bacterium]|nr:flavin reductase family protein [Eggerthellaceae bacterium]
MNASRSLSDFALVSGRDVAALQDPRPACLIGARSNAGEVCFATVIWVTPVSHNPEMVAFALRAKSHTMGIIRETGCFSISVPPADAEGVRLVEFCGGNTGRLVDKGAAVEHELVRVGDVGNATDAADRPAQEAQSDAAAAVGASEVAAAERLVPVLLHSFSWEVGVVESIQEAGDHLLVVGVVTKAGTLATRDERAQLTPYESLLCVQHGAYAKATRIQA